MGLQFLAASSRDCPSPPPRHDARLRSMSSGEIALVVMLLVSVITPSVGLLIWAAIQDGKTEPQES
jgi:hypothetical protein